ncbi:hypothetical protein D9Q98_008261 [Chlorella vulgaris]|uniref:Uncharacterized protein n=1 Tax=Chlorella vulgaris TaxID=3077 RepID=A0A9D4TGD3_CHLVU|nr:hypothetical protein D9Q98_008261 [Chlorella vulgaris]
MSARRLAALSLLLGCCAALASTTEPGAANAAQASTATVLPRRRLASFCNTSAAALEQMVDSAKPQPCTEEQEQDSLNNLATELPDIGDVSQTIIDRSECNATDADGYTQAVDLFDFELIETVDSVANDYVNAQGPESYWQSECNGDLTYDPYNACRQPQAAAAAGAPAADKAEEDPPGVHFKIWMKLSCAGSDNDTIALEAHAFLSRVASNDSVTVYDVQEIPLPGPGQ